MISRVGVFLKGSELEGVLPNGVYAVIQIDDYFVECLFGNSTNNSNMDLVYIMPSAKFMLGNLGLGGGIKIEQCILENFTIFSDNEQPIWVIKICEEDDNLSELYGGLSEENPYFLFFITIPYYIPENDDTSSSSTYSLRKTNLFENLREKIEQMRQQNLDKSAE